MDDAGLCISSDSKVKILVIECSGAVQVTETWQQLRYIETHDGTV